MQVVKRIITVPPSRELRIQLPEEAAAHEEAEVIVRFKSSQVSHADKLAAMREAAVDPLYLADMNEVAEDFQHADSDQHAI
ncbi:MAG TPA: hypothetical protein VD835_01770 [Pyrinomonadaceae bacterium]|nr:hypothetical protein [Pyrinomonadaceae bacterium]